MSESDQKSCGTCFWGEHREDSAGKVECVWIFHNKTPDAIHYSQSYMRESDGVCCACYRKRSTTAR